MEGETKYVERIFKKSGQNSQLRVLNTHEGIIKL